MSLAFLLLAIAFSLKNSQKSGVHLQGFSFSFLAEQNRVFAAEFLHLL